MALIVFLYSIKNLRRNTSQIDATQKRLQVTAQRMRRQSYLAELELRYQIALVMPGYPVGAGSSFLLLMIEYIDQFYDQADVTHDIQKYFVLLKQKDALAIVVRIEMRIEQVEEKDHDTLKAKAIDIEKSFVCLKSLRLRFILIKLKRLFSLWEEMDKMRKVEAVVYKEVFGTFLKAMEAHPSAPTSTGIGANHQKVEGMPLRPTLSEIDLENAQDLVVIAVEILLDHKEYEPTILNPHNTASLMMLEHAL